MKKALIVFIKDPVPGRVKTRLQSHLAQGKIVELYKLFVNAIISRCVRLKGIDKFAGCFPAKDNDFFRGLARTYKIRCFNQQGNDLGEKLVNAFKSFFKKGYTDVVIIGSDSPTIPADYIKKAFSELKKKDFVLGPCCDGGLYLVGAKKKIRPAIFRNIPWDTTRVLNRTLNKMLERLDSLDVKFSMLPFWYDIDTVEDLKLFKNHIKYLKMKEFNKWHTNN